LLTGQQPARCRGDDRKPDSDGGQVRDRDIGKVTEISMKKTRQSNVGAGEAENGTEQG
jgi:hypothetical protein